MKILSVNNAKEALYYLRKEQERRDTVMWRGRTTLVNIKDMSEEHLKHVINSLEKQEKLEEILWPASK